MMFSVPAEDYKISPAVAKAVDRIFDQVPRKFKSEAKDKMNYEDFVWFMLSEEDKTTLRSLQNKSIYNKCFEMDYVARHTICKHIGYLINLLLIPD